MSVRDLRVASLRRRAAAQAIDVVIVVPPLAAVVVLYIAYARRRGLDAGSIRLPDPSRRWQVAWWLLSTAGAVRWRNSRSPGGRITHVRRVDARTGGAVSVRSALTRSLFGSGWLRLASRLPSARAEPTAASPSQWKRAAIGPLALALPALWPPLHQSLPDRVAGIVTVVED
jgi:hypothetical protein